MTMSTNPNESSLPIAIRVSMTLPPTIISPNECTDNDPNENVHHYGDNDLIGTQLLIDHHLNVNKSTMMTAQMEPTECENNVVEVSHKRRGAILQTG